MSYYVEDLSKYGYKAIVKDDNGSLFSCDLELATAIVKLLNAALFSKYEVKQFTFTPLPYAKPDDVVKVDEQWMPVDDGFEVTHGALHCRIGREFRACPPHTWRKVNEVLDADKLITMAKNSFSLVPAL